MRRIIFHIDVNSAYLSWSAIEKRKEGGEDLRLVPSIIGGSRENRHGIVLAKSMPAKAFHIYTSEPIVDALRKCPDLVIEPPDHELYQRYSAALMEMLEGFCPFLEQLSIDECFLDFSPIASEYESPEAAAAFIRDRIYDIWGYTVNIGISVNKVLAKMASDFEKPGRVHTLYPDEIADKLWPLPVERLYMCGRSSAEVLKKLEIHTIGELARFDLNILTHHLKSHGRLLWEYANGIDDSPLVSEPAEQKGIGNSITLRRDAVTAGEAKHALLGLSESVSSRLRAASKNAGSLTTEMKYSTFRSVSHQLTLPVPSHSGGEIYAAACELFDALWDGTPIRLLGIRASKLTDVSAPEQMTIFDFLDGGEAIKSSKQKNLEEALDSIRQKYGPRAVVRGSLLDPSEFKKH